MKKVVLFDIDYTLFNTDLFRDLTYPQLRNILDQEDTMEYHAKIKDVERSLIKKGGYEPVAFSILLSEALAIPTRRKEIEQLFYNKEVYKQCLYSDATSVIDSLSRATDIQLGIVSKGEQTFQRRKIEPVIHYFKEEDIFISEDKTREIQTIKNAYQNYRSVVIDDSQVFLNEIQKNWNDVYTILMKRENRYEDRVDVEGFVPTAIVKTLKEVVPLVDKLLAE